MSKFIINCTFYVQFIVCQVYVKKAVKEKKAQGNKATWPRCHNKMPSRGYTIFNNSLLFDIVLSLIKNKAVIQSLSLSCF